jgi:type VI secretion system secreted protein VgrG
MARIFAKNEPLLLDPPGGVQGLHLLSMQLVEGLEEPYRVELSLRSQNALAAAQVLGLPVCVNVNLGEAPARHVHGLVSELAFLGRDAADHFYRVVARPWLWFLSRASNCRIFQELTVPDILKAVFREHGISDFEESLSQSYTAREFVVQYRESDLNFVSRLMQDVGIYYYFKHERAKHTMILCDACASHEPAAGYEALPYAPPDRQRAELVDHVDRWEVVSRVETGGLVSKDFDFEKPLADLIVARSRPAEHPQGGFEAFEYPGGYRETAEGEALLKLRLEQQACAIERNLAHSNGRGVCAGRLLTLKEHPVTALNREYLILTAALRIDNHDVESGGSGALPDCQFQALNSEVQFRPERAAPRPRIHGAQTAIVVGPKAEEIWTDEHGRVKVKFHWDRTAASDESSSCWIRVSQLWAGAGFGGIHVPRIGDEVIVEFLEGDPDRPIITGRVYNGLNKTPYELPLNQTQSGIRSHSTQGGRQDARNELRFEDAIGKEELYLRAERDKNVEVKRNRTTHVMEEDLLQVDKNRRVEVTGNLDVLVGSDGGVYRLDASESITLTAPKFILLKCGESSLMIEPEKITITSGARSQVVVDGAVLARSSGGSNLLLDENAQMTASGAATLRLDQQVQAQSAASAKLLLNANAQLDAAAVQIRGSGVVDVKGSQVNVNK